MKVYVAKCNDDIEKVFDSYPKAYEYILKEFANPTLIDIGRDCNDNFCWTYKILSDDLYAYYACITEFEVE